MRRRFFLAVILLIACAQALTAQQTAAPQAARPALSVVIDAAHGGTDGGARGATGVLEKEVTLILARFLRNELERQGFRVVLTRQGDENPTLDDRAGLANAQRRAIFLSLHVSSTGSAGSAQAYYFDFGAPAPSAAPAATTPVPAPRPALVRWERAQESHVPLSKRLAELVQIQLAQKFRGASETPVASAVRGLRSVAAPAIAIEISSVSVTDRKTLEEMAPVLAEAVGRGVAAFRPLFEAGVRP